MAFGWSATDIAQCVNLCFKIHRFCRNAGQDVQEVIDRFRYTRDQLVALEDLLQETGWRKPYRFAPDLKTDLEGHDEFFEKLPTLTSRTAVPGALVLQRSKDLARLALKQDDLNRIKANVDSHSTKLNEFKQDIVLEIVLRKFASEQRLLQHERVSSPRSQSLLSSHFDDGRSSVSDNQSIFSRAQQSLTVARQINHDNMNSRHRRSSSLGAAGTPQSLGRAQKYFRAYVKEVVAAAETGKLYARGVSLDEQVEQLRKIGDALDSIRERINSGSPESTRSLALLSIPTSPQSFEDSVRDSLASGDIELQNFWQPTPPSSVVPPRSPDTEFPMDSEGQPSSRTVISTLRSRRTTSVVLPPAHENFSSSSDLSSLQRNVEIGSASTLLQEEHFEHQTNAPLPLKLSGKAFFSGHRLMHGLVVMRHLTFALSEASACIRAGPEPTIMTPGRLFSDGPHDTRVFQHPFVRGLESFPRILHPAIDTMDPLHSQAPYTIHFIRPQFSNIERRQGSNHRSDQIKYHFETQDDRDLVREAIFGKLLLANAGVEEVQLNNTTICEMEIISLWQEKAPDGQQQLPISITAAIYSKRDRSAPLEISEYSVIDHAKLSKSLTKARKRGGKLALEVRSAAPRTFGEGQSVARQDSVSTAATNESSASQRLSIRRRSSAAQPKSDTMYIAFSEDNAKYREDKDVFLVTLEDKFCSTISSP